MYGLTIHAPTFVTSLQAWLKTVGYPRDCAAIPKQVILETLEWVNFEFFPCRDRSIASRGDSVLLKAGFVQSPEGGFDVAQFVDTDITTLT